MTCPTLRCSLLLTSLLATAVSAATQIPGGTITFHGAIIRSTDAPSATAINAPSNLVESVSNQLLGQARTSLSSDVLDFFATYAPPDAKLISVAYK